MTIPKYSKINFSIETKVNLFELIYLLDDSCKSARKITIQKYFKKQHKNTCTVILILTARIEKIQRFQND